MTSAKVHLILAVNTMCHFNWMLKIVVMREWRVESLRWFVVVQVLKGLFLWV